MGMSCQGATRYVTSLVKQFWRQMPSFSSNYALRDNGHSRHLPRLLKGICDENFPPFLFPFTHLLLLSPATHTKNTSRRIGDDYHLDSLAQSGNYRADIHCLERTDDMGAWAQECQPSSGQLDRPDDGVADAQRPILYQLSPIAQAFLASLL